MDSYDSMFSAGFVLNEQIARQIFKIMPGDGPFMILMDRCGNCWPSDSEEFSDLRLTELFLQELCDRIDDGSIVIHTFGAFFGFGVLMTMTTKEEFETPIESDSTSDRFSMLGSIILWLFWPSFCAALVQPNLIPMTAINVILALAGSTLATYFTSVGLRGKVCIADIANAALAGGVAIGSTCDIATPTTAFVIGVLAGGLSVFGFAVIQDKLQKLVKGIDTCGVMYLHGLPGILGGIAAVFVVKGAVSSQFTGIGITVVIAVLAGFIAGKMLSCFGRRTAPYLDSEEIE